MPLPSGSKARSHEILVLAAAFISRESMEVLVLAVASCIPISSNFLPMLWRASFDALSL